SDDKGRPCLEKSLQFHAVENGCDVYRTSVDASQELPLHKAGGLFYYVYAVSGAENFYLSASRDRTELQRTETPDTKTQLLFYRDDERPEPAIVGGTMYHVFVDRFFRSGKSEPREGSILNEDWDNGTPQYAERPGGFVANNMFFGGDLWGVIEKLDYIASLNVNCIYLSPIFEAASNHKYDTADYLRVDSAFGGDEALATLVKEAEKRGIYVILDGVFNHTGADSRYFNKFGNYEDLGAYQSKESPYYKWYAFKKYPDEYESWWGVDILPHIRSDEPEYRRFIYDEVVDKWMRFGIAGFRLDVADELSDDFLSGFTRKVKEMRPDAVVYGEVWEDASNKIAYGMRKRYFQGAELDSVMNYPLRTGLISYLTEGNDYAMREAMIMLYSHYPDKSRNLLMNLLGTHDTERILTRLVGDDFGNPSNAHLAKKRLSPEARKKGIRMLKQAYTVAATVPGVPCIYYGDEAGMEGYRDPFNRMPFPWGKEETELTDWYRGLGKLRKECSIFAHGGIDLHVCTPHYLAYSRFLGEDSILVVINRSIKPCYVASECELKTLLSTEPCEARRVPPLGAAVFAYKGDCPFFFSDPV
ncbi:MAG: glycoside hydrolase family 13 protein, partial [Clostridia bacterium]|nr:glycoside hydrolase family 13 protein [Clostridia bacterium]